MAKWLFKEEPTKYSFSELVKEKKAVWDGVKNNLAQKHLRSIKKGDSAFFYHTGKEKAVVGVMKVTRGPYPDPSDPDEKRVVVDVKPETALSRPVTLREIKESGEFQDFLLVRMSRLSVMPVTDQQWKRIIKMSESEG